MTIEIDKAIIIAIDVMANVIEILSMNIVEAAEFAAQVCGHSGQTVRRWAFSFFTSISAYSCLEDVDDDFISEELSSERGASSVKDTIIHNEDFKLAARSFVRENAYKKGEPNMTVQMFKDWIKHTYNLDVCHETSRLYLKRLGFNQVDHQKGVFFDGHERDDVILYRCELMDKLKRIRQEDNFTSFASTSPCRE